MRFGLSPNAGGAGESQPRGIFTAVTTGRTVVLGMDYREGEVYGKHLPVQRLRAHTVKTLVQDESQGEEWKSSVYASLMKLRALQTVSVSYLDTLGIFAK